MKTEAEPAAKFWIPLCDLYRPFRIEGASRNLPPKLDIDSLVKGGKEREAKWLDLTNLMDCFLINMINSQGTNIQTKLVQLQYIIYKYDIFLHYPILVVIKQVGLLLVHQRHLIVSAWTK